MKELRKNKKRKWKQGKRQKKKTHGKKPWKNSSHAKNHGIEEEKFIFSFILGY